ncbi:hypothetical protein ACFQ60_33030 [Streptomyces zhihengii]|uniref:hypothetical protein n=1 Tax=Streptomyces zhihengii TaxID=1818004 RepID=UPI001FD45AE2|nr:hypothetical protein [Streptomyces zhihengii]
MRIDTLVRPTAGPDRHRRSTPADGAPERRPQEPAAAPAPAPGPSGTRDTDGMAVAAFVLGLTGLLVMNIVLGPIAIVLASIALLRGTARRGRALLGLGLGVADLVVLAVLVTANGSVVWGFGG